MFSARDGEQRSIYESHFLVVQSCVSSARSNVLLVLLDFCASGIASHPFRVFTSYMKIVHNGGKPTIRLQPSLHKKAAIGTTTVVRVS